MYLHILRGSQLTRLSISSIAPDDCIVAKEYGDYGYGDLRGVTQS